MERRPASALIYRCPLGWMMAAASAHCRQALNRAGFGEKMRRSKGHCVSAGTLRFAALTPNSCKKRATCTKSKTSMN